MNGRDEHNRARCIESIGLNANVYNFLARSRSREKESTRKEYHYNNRNEPRVFKISIEYVPFGTRVSEVGDAFERYTADFVGLL